MATARTPGSTPHAAGVARECLQRCAHLIDRAQSGHRLDVRFRCHGRHRQRFNRTGPLASNGGSTETEALVSGSPAIDAGSAAVSCPSADQRGEARPDNGESNCDIGAYEYQDPTNYTLTVSKNGSGSGTVTSADGNINCGSTCSFGYASGSQVTLTATPASGSTFAGWSGGGCSGTGSCQLTMSSNQTVTATFSYTVAGACTMTSSVKQPSLTSSGQSISIENAISSSTSASQKLDLRSSHPQDSFELTSLSHATCMDNTSYKKWSGDSFNEITGEGSGSFGTSRTRAKPGYRIQFSIGDYGDGAGPDNNTADQVSFTIRNSAATIVWQGHGKLTSGSEEESG